MKEYWNGLTNAQKTKYIISAVAGILVLIFAILNWKNTELHLLFGRVSIPKTLLILMSMAGGFGLATLLDMRKFRKKDNEIKNLKSQLALKIEEEEDQI